MTNTGLIVVKLHPTGPTDAGNGVGTTGALNGAILTPS